MERVKLDILSWWRNAEKSSFHKIPQNPCKDPLPPHRTIEVGHGLIVQVALLGQHAVTCSLWIARGLVRQPLCFVTQCACRPNELLVGPRLPNPEMEGMLLELRRFLLWHGSFDIGGTSH